MRGFRSGTTSCLCISLFFLADAAAMSLDAKAMARFDTSYTKCEAKYPEMRGARDEAYLGMWRVKPDDRLRGELAAVRKGTAYQAETRRLRQQPAEKAAQLEQQCQALWGETLRVRSIAQ